FYWRPVVVEKTIAPDKVAIVICDMWDDHHYRGAAERVGEMAPRMNRVLGAARESGTRIIHAPSETMDFYANSPARKRMIAVPRVDPPALLDHDDPPLPIDDSDGGSDTGETDDFKAWSRQHPAIQIDEARDGISDVGAEVYSFVRNEGIEQVLIMGVHTNMCILRRSFAIKAMVRKGVPIALVRDLTDALHNPAKLPYVNHAAATGLVVEYIEKFWCPSIVSEDLGRVAN
ncbi:MAG TPA: isochorismatase family protein, partial [Chloroflexota bacterium]|nr:isochorismatase family protein [Chloroflexota bacterium]